MKGLFFEPGLMPSVSYGVKCLGCPPLIWERPPGVSCPERLFGKKLPASAWRSVSASRELALQESSTFRVGPIYAASLRLKGLIFPIFCLFFGKVRGSKGPFKYSYGFMSFDGLMAPLSGPTLRLFETLCNLCRSVSAALSPWTLVYAESIYGAL